MAAHARTAFRILTLLLCSLAAPMAVRAADAPATAEPACREEVHTGSRIKILVCPGDEGYEQGVRLGDQLQRSGDRQFTRSTRLAGLTVRAGAISSVGVHN